MACYRAMAKDLGPLVPMRGVMSCATREAVYTGGYLGVAGIVSDKIGESGITERFGRRKTCNHKVIFQRTLIIYAKIVSKFTTFIQILSTF